jgi:uncharacterized metal-binding protein YceD (DUF177 family)
MSKRLDAHPETRKFLQRTDTARHRGMVKAVERALTDEEIRARLKLTASDLDVLDRAINEVGAERNIGSRLLALKLKIAATVEPPTQRVSGDVSVQVVVNSMRKPAYELPPDSTSTTLLEE